MQLKFSLEAIFRNLYIFLGLTFPPCFCCTGDDCRNIIFKDPIPNMVMKNNTIKSVEVPNERSCRVMCYMEPNCVSINVGPATGGNQKCELNNATEKNHAPFLLVNKPGHTYLAIENPCSSGSCLNNGTCQAGFTSKGFRCVCCDGFIGESCQFKVLSPKKNCADIYKAGERENGMYIIKPDNLPAFEVFCDQTTDGGGWTVFQRRLDGSVDFYRQWCDYKQGFGDMNGEFWLGLDKIHRLTSNDNNILRVDLEDFDRNTRYAEYKTFGVMNENHKYKLILGDHSGTVRDSLSYHRDRPWSTRDQDNDDNRIGSCAILYKGAWWYGGCHHSNLNGLYHHGPHSSHGAGVQWSAWKGLNYSLKRAEMKIRPVDFSPP